MSDKIRIAICGYGNLGRGVESEIQKNPDMELVAIFTRRKPLESLAIKSDVPVVAIEDAENWKDRIDVMILCGGSATDLPTQSPYFAKMFNTVDSFDTHANIPAHFKAVDEAAKAGGNIAAISIGWDPGMFSVMRLYMESILPTGKTYTFWGPGVSQGHSEAVRAIDGVVDAIQYTIPVDSALQKVRSGENPDLTAREKHTRVCYVVAAEGADIALIEKTIVEMPNYFDEYDTTVNFISLEELKANHSRLPHGGNVINMGTTGSDSNQVIEFVLTLDSNPEFTSSVLIAYARAVARLAAAGETGARTIFDIPPKLLSRLDFDTLIKEML